MLAFDHHRHVPWRIGDLKRHHRLQCATTVSQWFAAGGLRRGCPFVVTLLPLENYHFPIRLCFYGCVNKPEFRCDYFSTKIAVFAFLHSKY